MGLAFGGPERSLAYRSGLGLGLSCPVPSMRSLGKQNHRTFVTIRKLNGQNEDKMESVEFYKCQSLVFGVYSVQFMAVITF